MGEGGRVKIGEGVKGEDMKWTRYGEECSTECKGKGS